MFRSPEHALAVAYGIVALPIEPKNGTQLVIEMLKERFDASYSRKEFSGLSPYEWHAQAAMIVHFTERELAATPMLLAVVRAEFGSGLDLAQGARHLSEKFYPEAGGSQRLAMDYLVLNLMRKRPSLQMIADNFSCEKTWLFRRQKLMKEKVAQLRELAAVTLAGPLQQAGVVWAEGVAV